MGSAGAVLDGSCVSRFIDPPSPSRSSGPIHLSPAPRGRGTAKLRRRHACHRIWPLKESREDGRVVTTSLVLMWVVTRPSLTPWRQATEGFGPPPPSGGCRRFRPGTRHCRPRDTPVVRDVRCSVCLRRRPATIGCRSSAGHAGLSGALGTVEPLPRVGGHRRPPRHPVHDPGSRESDARKYAGGFGDVEKD